MPIHQPQQRSAASPAAPRKRHGQRRRRGLAGTRWKAASGRWYVPAAGGRAVDRIEATGQVRGAAGGPTPAVRAPRDASVQLTARLREGGTLAAVR
ncbi:hypothetical protein AMK21_22810 [Streptomyces sp. CB00316]|nr:hypothetical protein AMK21_22810 [Streptomyces sp. CB00316]